MRTQDVKKTSHQFWETQPVAVETTSYDQKDDVNPFWREKLNLIMDPNKETGRIVSCKPEELLPNPLKLPSGYEWVEPDMKDMCAFLREFYATDPNDNFRLSYADTSIAWAITPPGFRRDWHIGIVKSDTMTLVAMITAVPSVVRVLDSEVPLVEINFLCVRPSHRSSGLAAIMIREISRRVAITGILAAIYTTALELPHLVTSTSYHHRPLNMKKLLNLKFCHPHPKLTMAGSLKQYALPDFKACPGLRPLKETDLRAACTLLNSYLAKYKVRTIFDLDSFKHHFLPREHVVYSYVVEKKGRVINFVSFYSIDTIAIRSDAKDKTIRSAYLSYVVDASIMPEILNLASRLGFDLFNCVDIMSNASFIKTCKFIMGTGRSNYYFYNWKCPKIEKSEMAVILI